MPNYRLSEKANFPESDGDAIRQVAEAQAIFMEFLDKFVRLANAENPEAIELWEIAKGLNAAVEVYNG